MGTRVVILDGYTDEPAGLGVPPYIDVYPRYIAGAVWSVEKSASVFYFTIDEVRKKPDIFYKLASKSDILVIVAGVVVPGRYIGGKPITLEETLGISRKIEGPIKVLAGPAARFGFGYSGGRRAVSKSHLKEAFDLLTYGDPEMVLFELLKEGSVERVNPYAIRRDYSLVSKFAVRGARVVLQHPNIGLNIIAEIETYRGCPRWVSGGCSFCIEPRFGKVVFRDPKDIAREISILYSLGVKSFRLGRQADFLAYMAPRTNEVEYPRPNPQAIDALMRMVRYAAPSLEALHIDNVNPMTIALHEEEAVGALKSIIKWHTPGDVAAFGLESADPRVVRANNIGNDPEMVLKAIEIVNRLGRGRGWNGMPEMLPGINFVLGLKGESRQTYRRNIDFLKEIIRRDLLVRRVNIREVLPLEGTPMWSVGDEIVRRHKGLIVSFKRWVRERFDKYMIRRVFPKYTVLRGLYVESHVESSPVARQPGSYPVVVYLTEYVARYRKVNIVVVGHKARSLIGVPIPLRIKKSSLTSLKMVLGESLAKRFLAKGNWADIPLKFRRFVS